MSACTARVWPAPQRRRGAGSRGCVVVRAGRQGRGGRFPATPHVSSHPLPLADVCEALRAGHTGAAVLSRWLALPTRDRGALYSLETQFNADAAVSDWRRALLAVPERLDAAAFPQARVLLTTVQPDLEAAIAMEASLASPGALPLGDGVFAAPLPAPPSRLCRMLSLRCEFEPLAAAASSADIITAVQRLAWNALDQWPEWRLHHERVRTRVELLCRASRADASAARRSVRQTAVAGASRGCAQRHAHHGR